MVEIKGRFGSKTDIGLVRPSNEDKAISLIDPQGNILLAVCDGMGGYMKGDFASKIAVDILSAAFMSKFRFIFDFQVKNWIAKMIKTINFSVFSEANDSEKFKGMGTTLVLAVLFKKKIFIANVGDSRMYRVGKKELEQLTKDQTYVDYLYNRGEITEEQKKTLPERHVLMNAIGLNKTVNYKLDVIPNEEKTILLCSDGLYNNASDKEIFSALTSNERVDQKVNTLIGIAKSHGGTDNIGISMWEPYKND